MYVPLFVTEGLKGVTRTAKTARVAVVYEIGPNLISLVGLNWTVLSELICNCPVTGVLDATAWVAFANPAKLLQVKTWPDPLLVILVGFDASNHALRPDIFVGKNVVV